MVRVCPDCSSALESEEILGIQLDICPECAGIWFDDGELLKLKELGEEEMEKVDDTVVPREPASTNKNTPSRLCPDCEVALEEYSYLYTSEVQLDTCPDCYGTWVQDGELRAMRTALDNARQSAENPQLMRSISHQLKAVELLDEHEQLVGRHRLVARVLRALSLRRLPQN